MKSEMKVGGTGALINSELSLNEYEQKQIEEDEKRLAERKKVLEFLKANPIFERAVLTVASARRGY